MKAEEFEYKFQLDNYEELENAFQEAKNYLCKHKGKITFDEIKERYPVRISKNKISIMLPTYKIWVLDEKISNEEIKEMIIGIKEIDYEIATDVVIWPLDKRNYPFTIHCRADNLISNTAVADKVMKIFKENQIKSERSVEIGFYNLYAKVDEKGYIIEIQR